MLDQNGSSALVQLVARIAELAAAVDHVTLALAEEWRPRMLQLERDVDRLLELMEARRAAAPGVGDQE